MSLEARFHEECFKKVAFVKKTKVHILPDAEKKIQWFRDSPDAGSSKCICSVCGRQILETEVPIRIFNEVNAE